MLTAIDKHSKQKIFIGDWSDRIDLLREKMLVDPIFGKSVFPRRAHTRKNTFVRSHFVGQAVYEESLPKGLILDPGDEYIRMNSDGTYRLGESNEHLQGKIAIANWAKDNLEIDWDKHFIEYEKRVDIPSKLGKYRIIDVAVTEGEKIKYALECQISPIELRSLNQRTFDYINAGIEPRWFFGRRSRTEANINFVFEEIGVDCHFLQFSEREETEVEWNSFKEPIFRGENHYKTPHQRDAKAKHHILLRDSTL